MIKAGDAIQTLEQYRNELDAMTHRLLVHGDMKSLRSSDEAPYLTTILAAQGLFDDVFGNNNQYSVLIKKIHNESMTSNGLQAPTLQSINAIIAVIDAAIRRLQNNPDFYTKEGLISQRIISAKTKTVWHETMAFKVLASVLIPLLVAYLVYYFGWN